MELKDVKGRKLRKGSEWAKERREMCEKNKERKKERKKE